MIIRGYKPEDWLAIEDPVEPFVPQAPVDEFLELTKNSLSITGLEDGKVMSCGGVIYLDDKHGLVWLKVSQKCKGSVEWALAILQSFQAIKVAVGPIELSTYILSDFCKSERIARMAGFRKTGEETTFNGKRYNKYTIA